MWKNIGYILVVPLVAFLASFLGILEFFGGLDLLKANLYKYQNNHLYIPYGKKVTKLDKNIALKQCDRYEIRFDIENIERWWIPDFWSTIKNSHVYVFQVDKKDNRIYKVERLYKGPILFSEGPLSLPKNSENQYFSLQNSKLGEKEIYLFSSEEPDENLEKESDSLSHGGKNSIFYENYLKPKKAIFSFYLEESEGACNFPIQKEVAAPIPTTKFSLDIEVKYLYRKNGKNDFQELKDGEVLHSGDQYKVEFKHDNDIAVYVFLTNDTQEKARVLFPCYEDYQDSFLEFGSDSYPLIAGEKNILPNPTEVGYWQLNNSVGDKQIHFLVFEQRFSPIYSNIGQCKISFDTKLKDEIIFESLLKFKHVQ